MNSKSREVKVVLLGDTGVGKSSLVLRFVTNNFRPYSESTIGASFMSKMIMVNNMPIKFQIWDTAGQEKYHSLAPMYYRGAGAAIVVYDITRESSFKTLKEWISELQTQGPDDIAIAIAGNKKDLASQREVSEEEARQYADEIGALFFESSAKDDIAVHEIFIQLSKRLPEKDPLTATGSFNLNAGNEKNGCCG
eukprot:CAMPEP_0117756976 /NCGR_PEP_ID=MMETSP0947-20121206/14433_1 /TAXON_ID=44440 /ORGANISM="Chattonella subsalsa, Strain CCMP2191" /LENGTH=193 /DNA_ID=CAMNT_0005576735 /DNA_START=35 /DNA_END=616 /DNA_ORIENTATION=-